MNEPDSQNPDTDNGTEDAPGEGARRDPAADPKSDPTADGKSAEPATEARSRDLEERLRVAEKQVALIRQAHAEAAAEFDKVKERMRRHQEQEIERARQNMANNLFEVADNFDRTIDAAQQGSDRDTLLRGVMAVREALLKAMTGFGLVRYGASGDRFDPELHEAIGMIPVAAQMLDGTITVVFESGYRAADRVLRPARVQVGRYVAPPTEPELVN